MAAELGGVIAGVNLKFLNRIDGRGHCEAIVDLIANQNSVEQENIVLIPGPIRVNGETRKRKWTAEGALYFRHDARRQQRQLDKLTAIQWKFASHGCFR